MLYNHLSINMKDEENEFIKSSVKAIDKNKANIEAEKGELLLAPDLSTIHKITGKKHSRGGSPIQAEEDSFLFSDSKKLAFTEKEKKLFEFKEGGKFNTPAKILSKEIDLKHHNRMYDILADNKKIDPIAKKTASLMLTKNIEKIGQVAYLQEAKKRFPNGVPDFAKGSAPVYSEEVKNKIDSELQFMKYGGQVLRKMELAGIPPYDVKPRKNNKQYNNPNSLEYYLKGAELLANPQILYGLPNSKKIDDISDYQNFMVENYPELINDAYDNNSDDFGLNNKAYSTEIKHKYGIPENYTNQQVADFVNKLSPQFKKRFILDQFRDGLYGEDALLPLQKVFTNKEEYDNFIKDKRAITTKNNNLTFYNDPNNKRNYYNVILKENKENNYNSDPKIMDNIVTNNTVNDATLKPNEFVNKKISYLNQKVPFTPWQLGNIGYSALQAASVKRYMPYRQQINPLTVELEKTNPNQQLNDVDSMFTKSAQLNKIIGNSSQAGANTADLFVKALQSKNQIRSQYDNQNVQIANQQNLTNNQILNNARNINESFNKRYYDELTAAYQNYDIEKRGAVNQAVSLANMYKTGNMQLQNALAQQEMFPLLNADGSNRLDKYGNQIYGPAYSYDYNGNYIHNKANGLNQVSTIAENEREEFSKFIKSNPSLESADIKYQVAAYNYYTRNRTKSKGEYGGNIPKLPKLKKPKF